MTEAQAAELLELGRQLYGLILAVGCVLSFALGFNGGNTR